jgi:hypothetical protein
VKRPRIVLLQGPDDQAVFLDGTIILTDEPGARNTLFPARTVAANLAKALHTDVEMQSFPPEIAAQEDWTYEDVTHWLQKHFP